MTNTHLQLYAHQLGMMRAARSNTPQAMDDWRAHAGCREQRNGWRGLGQCGEQDDHERSDRHKH